MEYVSELGEVDHFDPAQKKDRIQDYDNLFLSSRHCNRAKSDDWPSPAQKKKGLRFLNCCKEQDYGVHIFEDQESHHLVGVTPAGRWHIMKCDLNSPVLVDRRKDRSKIINLLKRTPATVTKTLDESYLEIRALLDELLEKHIPEIPYYEG